MRVVTVTALCLALSGCLPGSGGTGSGLQTFSGHYVTSFEVSSFVPCGDSRRPGYGAGWWLAWDASSGGGGRVPDAGNPSAPPVYLRFVGSLKTGSHGGYGHLGAYRGEVTVHRLLESHPGGQCPGTTG